MALLIKRKHRIVFSELNAPNGYSRSPALFGLCVRSEIRRRGGPQCFSEHGDESTWGAVPRFESRVGDLRALRQKAHRLHQAKLLSPLAEGQAHVLLEESLHRSPAGARRFAKIGEWPAVPRVGQQYFGDSERPRIGRSGKLQRNRLNGRKLVEDYVYQMSLPRDSVLQSAKQACMENEFLQQWRHVYHATRPRQGFRQSGPEIQSAHRHRA